MKQILKSKFSYRVKHNGEKLDLLKLISDYKERNSRHGRKDLEIKHLWPTKYRKQAIRYGNCGLFFMKLKCDNCKSEFLTHTDSCNLRICSDCCKKSYWRIKKRVYPIVEKFGYVPHQKIKQIMTREITLTWKQGIENLTDLKKIISERRKEVNRLLGYFRRKKRLFGGICSFEIKRNLDRVHIHIHILIISKFITHRELSEKWEKISGNRVVWIQLRRPESCINYLLKHLYKPPEILPSDTPMFFEVFEKKRRITTFGMLYMSKRNKLLNFTCDMAISSNYRCPICMGDLRIIDTLTLNQIVDEVVKGVG